MPQKSNAALLIVAHGSTVNPDSSAPTLARAAEIRRRKVFADVGGAFWKEEPEERPSNDIGCAHQMYEKTRNFR